MTQSLISKLSLLDRPAVWAALRLGVVGLFVMGRDWTKNGFAVPIGGNLSAPFQIEGATKLEVPNLAVQPFLSSL